jgi:hypothetical protein
MSKTYVGDTGTLITLDCGVDVSAATGRSILARKPDGTQVTWTAQASGTNSIAFATLVGSLDQAGKWRLQAQVVMPSGTWKGETAVLTVYPPFA